MSKQNEYSINLYTADNTVSGNNDGKKIFKVQSSGTVDMDMIVNEMAQKYPLIPPETIRMLLRVSQNIQIRSLLEGKRVNMGMYIADLQCKGVTSDGRWNPAVNSLYANFRPGKKLREAVSGVAVKVVGEKSSPMYITRAESSLGKGFTAVAGLWFILYGKYLKVVGDHPSVGVWLIAPDGAETKITFDMMGENLPSKIMFQLPKELEEGEYVVRVVTQYSSGNRWLKEPRGVEEKVWVKKDRDFL